MHPARIGTNATSGSNLTLASAVAFDFAARDAVEDVARGKHNRFVVGVEKTAQRLQAKRARAGGRSIVAGRRLRLTPESRIKSALAARRQMPPASYSSMTPGILRTSV